MISDDVLFSSCMEIDGVMSSVLVLKDGGLSVKRSGEPSMLAGFLRSCQIFSKIEHALTPEALSREERRIEALGDLRAVRVPLPEMVSWSMGVEPSLRSHSACNAPWYAFTSWMLNATNESVGGKVKAPVWSPCCFSSGSNGRGGISLLPFGIGMLVLDCDKGQDWSRLIQNMSLAGIAGVFHTTASSTPERPRWRVIVPLGARVQPVAYPTVVRAFSDLLSDLGGGLEFDMQATDPGRRWFQPVRIWRKVPTVVVMHGDALGVRAE